MYGTKAYALAHRNSTVPPRVLEGELLMKAAAQLSMAWKNTDEPRLTEALKYNQKLWIILVSSATSVDNPLPIEVKNNLGNIGVFVLKSTIKMMLEPSDRTIDVLISINRNIASGLRDA